MGSRRAKPGRTLGLGPPNGQSWIWMTGTMVGSITFAALSINARRVLDYLMLEHMSHAGQENGNLAATYRQLAQRGVTEADISRAIKELIVAGFVDLKHQGMRQAGGGEPSRYALTWLPTFAGSPIAEPPSQRWLTVVQDLSKVRIDNPRKVKRWLREQTADKARGSRKKSRATPHLRVVPIVECGGRIVS